MLTITPAARDYFTRLLSGQPEGTNLRLAATNPGTPAAAVELNYCPAGEERAGDHPIDCKTFVLYVDADSANNFADAIIDFESDEMGGELTIRAPGLKGRAPDEDAPLTEKVRWMLDARINPMVAAHGGRVGLVEITRDNDVVLQFGGGCHGCGMVDVTLKQGIETTLKSELPEIRRIIDATDHDTGENPYYARD